MSYQARSITQLSANAIPFIKIPIVAAFVQAFLFLRIPDVPMIAGTTTHWKPAYTNTFQIALPRLFDFISVNTCAIPSGLPTIPEM